ncbi:MAG: helix-turn-helix transcriptional regulator [Myxococcales bacterium]|jgi:AraC-like DNA-binding protein|nr:helix-turn-helix transcriptional regulator [Myxococcales bacterium]MBL0193581.1 helix-turn-helix transcriptional regulator [Myxococcales bacterium]
MAERAPPPRPETAPAARPEDGGTHILVLRDPRALERERVAARPTLVVPLEGAVVVEAAPLAARVDRAKLALVPARARFRLRAAAPVAPTALVELGAAAEEGCFVEYAGHVDRSTYAEVMGEPRVLPRTRWVHELVHRYVFERTVCEKHASQASRFLETELVKEIYFLGGEALAQRTRASVTRDDAPLVARARALLDAHLFDDVGLPALCKRLGASESTLSRAFQREVGTSPAAYRRGRRLEEARLMLETGVYSASEVAHHVGYATLAAFTAAFSRRFGEPPSAARGRALGGAHALPPHGEPPRRPTRVPAPRA